MFPEIKTIDDVLPAIEGDATFNIIEKQEGYTVINYYLQNSDTFPPIHNISDLHLTEETRKQMEENNRNAAIRRECRGIIFDTATKEILRRPFHKFFNWKEKPGEDRDTFSEHDLILEKVDGSMISPFYLDGNVRWGSKMGLTDVAAQAEAFVKGHPEYERLAQNCLYWGNTPIFEWVSKKQRIVLDYPKDNLVLIAIRNMVSGEYSPYNVVQDFGEIYDIPVVKMIHLGNMNELTKLKEHISSQENTEGVVVTYSDGHRVKLKTEWYCTLHRAKESITREKDVVSLILDNKLDDLLPILLDEDYEKVIRYRDKVLNHLSYWASGLEALRRVIRENNIDRKTFAINSEKKWSNNPQRAWVFTLWEEKDNSLDFCTRFVHNWVKDKTTSTNVFQKHVKSVILKEAVYDEKIEE